MSPIRRLDAWIGARVLVPVIVRVCRFTKWSQWAFARYALMLFWIVIVADDVTRPFRWFMAVDAIVGFVAVANAGLRAHEPIERSDIDLLFRLISVSVAALCLVSAVTGGPVVGFAAWSQLVLYWYAKTIDTIPPAEAKKRAAKLARAAA